MLTFEQKLDIIETFSELEKHNVSLGRVNFHLEDSHFDKKTVVYHLHPNGNGFVYTGNLPEYKSDPKGYTNIREFSAEELKEIIEASIHSLTPEFEEEEEEEQEFVEEQWINSDYQLLVLVREDDLWNVYAGQNLDGTFATYNQAVAYLDEEGFKKR